MIASAEALDRIDAFERGAWIRHSLRIFERRGRDAGRVAGMADVSVCPSSLPCSWIAIKPAHGEVDMAEAAHLAARRGTAEAGCPAIACSKKVGTTNPMRELWCAPSALNGPGHCEAEAVPCRHVAQQVLTREACRAHTPSGCRSAPRTESSSASTMLAHLAIDLGRRDIQQRRRPICSGPLAGAHRKADDQP